MVVVIVIVVVVVDVDVSFVFVVVNVLEGFFVTHIFVLSVSSENNKHH